MKAQQRYVSFGPGAPGLVYLVSTRQKVLALQVSGQNPGAASDLLVVTYNLKGQGNFNMVLGSSVDPGQLFQLSGGIYMPLTASAVVSGGNTVVTGNGGLLDLVLVPGTVVTVDSVGGNLTFDVDGGLMVEDYG